MLPGEVDLILCLLVVKVDRVLVSINNHQFLNLECKCYNHSNTCRYDSTIKEGICEDCQDNTAGTNCDKCSPGHTRNRNASMSHANICKGE